jgi:hypothetical protein
MAVDLLAGGKGQGDVANYFASSGQMNTGMMRPYLKNNGRVYVNSYLGGDPASPKNWREIEINRNMMQVNSTLRRDEWKRLDEVILEISRQRLVVEFGLGRAIGNAEQFEWHDVSDPGEAVISMDGVTRGNHDRPNFQYNYLPIPIIHFDYELNARELAASRNLGNPLDTTMAERAIRRVNEQLENMLFTNITFSYGEKDQRNRNSIYSYLNHPDRNIVSLGTNWDELDFDSGSANGGKIIVDKVASMKQTSIEAKHYGPWMLYISTNYETTIDKDYDTTTPGTTIRERIMKIGNIKGIKVIDTLPADNVLLVQMTSDVVRLVRGMGITNVEWAVEGNMISKYKVMTIQVPQIRSDQNGACGIVHAA